MKKAIAITATIVLLAVASPALADGDDTVVNENSAYVSNTAVSSATTGSNLAGGSYGGDGGRGGNITNEMGDVDDSATGNGGDGGAASTGGTVVTGTADAWSSVDNRTNINDTEINRCSCDGDEDGNTRVRNTNMAEVMNTALSGADTGMNFADGSFGGSGGEGGDIDNAGDEDADVDDSTTGSGGTGASGGLGGLVQTSASTAGTSVVNVVNRNVTRILR